MVQYPSRRPTTFIRKGNNGSTTTLRRPAKVLHPVVKVVLLGVWCLAIILLAWWWWWSDSSSSIIIAESKDGSPRLTLVTSFWAEAPKENFQPRRLGFFSKQEDDDDQEAIENDESSSSIHRQEIEAALLNNMNNPQFHQIVVILDSITSKKANCRHFKQRMKGLQHAFWKTKPTTNVNDMQLPFLTCVEHHGGQPTYYEMFQYAVAPTIVLGEMVVLANADHAFDDSLRYAKYHLHPTTNMLVLASSGYKVEEVPSMVQDHYQFILPSSSEGEQRRNHRRKPIKRCGRTTYSWDTYIFHVESIRGTLHAHDFRRKRLFPTTTTTNNGEMVVSQEEEAAEDADDDDRTSRFFYMNENGAENAALHALLVNNPNNAVQVYNACPLIHSWHFHFGPQMHKEVNNSTLWQNEKDGPEFVPEPHRRPNQNYQDAFVGLN